MPNLTLMLNLIQEACNAICANPDATEHDKHQASAIQGWAEECKQFSERPAPQCNGPWHTIPDGGVFDRCPSCGSENR